MFKKKKKKIYIYSFFIKRIFLMFFLYFSIKKKITKKLNNLSFHLGKITVSIYIYNFCIFVLSALNKILFPCVSNFGSKGRDAVKTPFPIPFYSIQYIKTIQLPLQYRMLLIMYRSLLITARLLLIIAVCYLS
jgi:hypothetical protein